MLGRLKMSVAECIEAYASLSDAIFQKKRSRLSLRGKTQGRFDSDELERAVKQMILRNGLSADEMLEDTTEAACRVLVS